MYLLSVHLSSICSKDKHERNSHVPEKLVMLWGPGMCDPIIKRLIRFQPQKEREHREYRRAWTKKDVVEANTQENVPSEIHWLCLLVTLKNLNCM